MQFTLLLGLVSCFIHAVARANDEPGLGEQSQRVILSGSSSCPAPQQVATELGPLLPRWVIETFDDEDAPTFAPKSFPSDVNNHLVLIDGATGEQLTIDGQRSSGVTGSEDCRARAKDLSVVIALVLDPPEIDADESPPALPPTKKDDAQLRDRMAAVSPHFGIQANGSFISSIGPSRPLRALGGIMLYGGIGRWLVFVDASLATRSTWDVSTALPEEVSARILSNWFSAGIGYRLVDFQRFMLAGRIGPTVELLFARADGLVEVRSTTASQWGVRLGVEPSIRLFQRLTLGALVEARYFPQTARLLAEDAGTGEAQILATVPHLLLSAGVSVGLQFHP